MAPHYPINSRYRIEYPVGAGTIGTLYHAVDRLMGSRVAFKHITAPLENLAVSNAPETNPITLLTMLDMASRLRHPNLLPIRDYGLDAYLQPFFTTELLTGAKSFSDSLVEQPLTHVANLTVQALNGLSALHARGILHGNLKPHNLLVRDNHPFILDFGIAVQGRRTRGRTVVTLAYTPPEGLSEGVLRPTADLYALGVMLYEGLTRRHPLFNVHKTSGLSLVDTILYEPPDPAPLHALWERDDPRRVLTPLVLRLLSKNPAERPQNVAELTAELCDLCGLPAPEAPAYGPYRHYIPLTGRDQQVIQITKSLSQSMRARGQGWLITGESGVGKTRLMDEICIRAAVAGFFVLRGAATPEGGAGYSLWRLPLRRLAIEVPIDDFEAGCLAALIPDIADLLEREIPPLPALTGSVAQTRLLEVVYTIFGRLKRPTLIVLEDIHWSTEAAQVIRALTHRLRNHPIMLVATCLASQAPNIPALLPLALSNLTPQQTIALAENLLGPLDTLTASFLAEKTQGMPLYIVEAARLIEGGGRDFGDEDNMIEIFNRRLNEVPVWAQPLLGVASLCGRMIDLALIGYLSRVNQLLPAGLDIQAWLYTCADVAILSVREDQWRFSHEYIRQAIQDSLPPEESQRFHQWAAHAIQALYPNQPSRARDLAGHFAVVEDYLAAYHSAVAAGTYYRALESFPPAVAAFTQAVDHLKRLRLPLGGRYPYTELCEKLGSCCLEGAQFAEAYQWLHQAIEGARANSFPDVLGRALVSAAVLLTTEGKTAEGLTLLDEAIPLVKAFATPAERAKLFLQISAVYEQQEMHDQQRVFLELALALTNESDNLWTRANILREYALCQPDPGLRRGLLEESLSVSASVGLPIHASIGDIVATFGLAALDIAEELYAPAYQRLEEGVHAADLAEWPLGLLFGLGYLARLLLRQGQSEQAIGLLGIVLSNAQGNRKVVSVFQPDLDQVREGHPETLIQAALLAAQTTDLATARRVYFPH